jgi:TRAP-type C4-dicarboxylate transport system permease small subunit
MTRISRAVNRLANLLNAVASWGLVVTGVLMSLIVFFKIVFRYVVYVPFPWSEESARYLMIWMSMLGAAVALRHGRHIGVTVLVEKLPGALSRWLTVFLRLAMLFFLLIIAKEGFSLAMFNAGQYSAAMDISMFLPYSAIPVGAVLMSVELIADLFHEFHPTEAGADRQVTTRVL